MTTHATMAIVMAILSIVTAIFYFGNIPFFESQYAYAAERECIVSSIVTGFTGKNIGCPYGKMGVSLADLKKSNKETHEVLQAEFNLNQKMANAIAECWSSSGFGRNDLFPDWKSHPDLKQKLASGSEEYAMWRLISEDSKVYLSEPPLFCQICKKVSFDKDVIDYVRDKTTIRSLFTWMKQYNVPATSKKYLNYIKDPQAGDDWLLEKWYNYDVEEKDIAIVYVQQNIYEGHWPIERFSKLAPKKGAATIHSVRLFPWKSLWAYCDILANQ